MMSRLIYTGSDPASQWVAGWPASDHDDDDAASVKAKVASGLYRVGDEPSRPPRKPADDRED